jgi:hypothetical protein
MEFKPFNRYILVEKIEPPIQKETPSTILVPDSYITREPHTVYRIASIASDCEHFKAQDVGKIIVLNTAMIENIKVTNYIFDLVLENYVYGIIEDHPQEKEE